MFFNLRNLIPRIIKIIYIIIAYYQGQAWVSRRDRLRRCQLNRSAQLGNGVIIKLIVVRGFCLPPSIGDLALLNGSRFIPYDKAITDARSVVLCIRVWTRACVCVHFHVCARLYSRISESQPEL